MLGKNNFTLQIKEEAKHDIKYAVKWYDDIDKKLGTRFVYELETIFNNIIYNPKTYKKVYKNFRQAALHKFPYVVLYEPEKTTVIIYSLFNTRQNPKKKLRRLQ